MKKIILLFLGAFLVLCGDAYAQTRHITGRVLDENGEGLPGAGITVRGTSTGTVTDVEGNFALDLPEGRNELIVQSIGYTTQTVTVTGNTITVNVKPEAHTLNETVVTALGIRRQVRSLTYATQDVQADELTVANNPNVQNALQGKVSGLTIKQSSGMPGASTLITLRGSRFLDANNQPLIVVDGVPIEGGTEFLDDITEQRVAGSDAPSRLADINPNDIESINVLKGAPAAALYGLRASNGVIVITTKKAKAGDGQKGIYNIEFYTNYTWDKVARLPDLQTTYAQGSGGQFRQGTSISFGPRIDTMANYDVVVFGDTIRRNQTPQVYDNISPLFRTGFTTNTGVGFNVGGNSGSMRVSLGHTKQQGILPGSDMRRITAAVSGEQKLGERFVVSASGNYTDMYVNKLTTGSNLSNPLLSGYFAPRTYDMWGLPYQNEFDPTFQYNYRSSFDNPRWSLAHNDLYERNNRFFGNINGNYAFNDWLSANYRLGIDYYSISGKEFYDIGSGNTGGAGMMTNYNIRQSQVNSNLSVTFNKEWEKFGANLTLGNESYDIRNIRTRTDGSGLAIPGLENISNASSIQSTEYHGNQRVVGNYGSLELSYLRAAYLTATLRNDRVSNLPSAKRSFTYPSVGVSVLPSEFFKINRDVVNYLKIRASWAQVGQPPAYLYVQRQVLVPGGSSSGFLEDNYVFPQNGIVGFANSTTLIDPNLKPQNTNSTEIGFDFSTWNSRLTLNYTYFNSVTDDQIFPVPIAPSTGYTQYLSNGGSLKSYGHEATLRITPVRTRTGFTWNFVTNFTQYRNKVEELAPGVENIYLGGFDVPNVRAQAGQFYPVIYGVGYLRDDQGRMVVDDDPTSPYYGMPVADPNTKVIGNVAPDFEFSFQNTFSYKGLSLYVQFDWRKGGQMYSGNNRLGETYGMLAVTEDRESDYVVPNAVAGHLDADGNLVVTGDNDIVIQRNETYWNTVLSTIDEAHVHSTTFIRLREISLSYDLPASLLNGQKVVKKISLNAFGRNLWLKTDYPNFDPEANTGGAVNGQGIEYIALPQVKSYGIGLRATF